MVGVSRSRICDRGSGERAGLCRKGHPAPETLGRSDRREPESAIGGVGRKFGNLAGGLLTSGRANPKSFCGYSDITSLHLAFMRHSGLSTFYGPAVMPSFGEWPELPHEMVDSFLDATIRHLAGPRELVAPSRWSRHLRDARTDPW